MLLDDNSAPSTNSTITFIVRTEEKKEELLKKYNDKAIVFTISQSKVKL